MNSINQNKSNPSEQIELLQVLNRTIESDRQFMDVPSQESATNLLVDMLAEVRDEKLKEISEQCRLGLGELKWSSGI
jgi:hypothetical protein